MWIDIGGVGEGELVVIVEIGAADNIVSLIECISVFYVKVSVL